MKDNDIWWFLGLADYVATKSKDPSTKVGAVIVDPDNHVVSIGYNGFPKGLLDTSERLNNREYKYAHTVHAERNAMIFSNRTYLDGCSIFITHPPCSSCLIEMKQRRMVNVFCYDGNEDFRSRWNVDHVLTTSKEVGIIVNLVTKD